MLVALRQVADREATRRKQPVRLGSLQPGLERGGHRFRVDGDELIQAAQVESHDSSEPVTFRIDTTDNARAATERHDGDAMVRAGAQYVDDLIVITGQDDGVGRVLDRARAQSQQVGRALAGAAQEAAVVIGTHVLVAHNAGQR